MAISRLSCTSCTAARMEAERSSATSMEEPGGRAARRAGRAATTPSTTSTVLASGWRCTARVRPRTPFRKEATRSFCTPSTTSATSDSRTGAPERPAMTRFPKASASGGWSFARSTSCCRWPLSVPDGGVGIRRRHRVADLVEREAHRRQTVGPHPHAHGEELLAIGHHLRDARHAGEGRGDEGRGDVVQLVERHVAAARASAAPPARRPGSPSGRRAAASSRSAAAAGRGSAPPGRPAPPRRCCG